ncbi:hypothetical protein [Pedobacter frigoris]|uniref:hypothetical protein n=1 Tax=Pedobacter frigoris TaxID=2571272 RepID=UPI00293034C0|nr:hypothetical protein [Pedobacter frigoris]
MNKAVKINRSLEISIYLKSNNKADVVFRKKSMLYRIGIREANQFLINLGNHLQDLKRALVLQLEGSRMRKWVLELGLAKEEEAVLQVWEMVANEMKPCFEWAGLKTELEQAISR